MNRYVGYALGAVVAVAVFAGLQFGFGHRDNVDTAMASMKAQFPFVQDIQQYDPALYAELKRTLQAEHDSAQSLQQTRNAGQQLMISYTTRNLPRVDDATAVRIARLQADALRPLLPAYANVCAAMVNGKPIPIDLNTLPGAVDRGGAVISAVVRARKADNRPAMSTAEMTRLFAANRAAIAHAGGMTESGLAASAGSPPSDTQVCRSAIGIYGLVATLPTPAAAALMRGLAKG